MLTKTKNKKKSGLLRMKMIVFVGGVVLLISLLSNASAINIGVEDFYINIGVEDLYINIGVADFYNQMGVDITEDTTVQFDKGYILTPVMEVKPGQWFKGVVKDAGKLTKAGAPKGVKNGDPVVIHCLEKGKFRMSFSNQSSINNPASKD